MQLHSGFHLVINGVLWAIDDFCLEGINFDGTESSLMETLRIGTPQNNYLAWKFWIKSRYKHHIWEETEIIR